MKQLFLILSIGITIVYSQTKFSFEFVDKVDTTHGPNLCPLNMDVADWRKVVKITCSSDPNIRKDSVLVILTTNGKKRREGYMKSDCGWGGQIKEYYVSGKIQVEKKFKGCGSQKKPIGTWKYYGEDGKLIKTETYSNSGELLKTE